MKSNYKRLGDYIRPVNIRNKDLQVTKLLGVSIQKILMPSIANTVGTNMKTYKIIKKNQFAYGSVTSRNGDKISIALLQDFDEAIISQAYTVFEVIDTNEVNPEYLIMWFRRPEFDRYARYKSHGSARETFDWDEMCEVELPIPNIEKQNAIVKEYNTVVNRIKINEQLNQKLEETAQAIYKHWFVDFEFPFDFTQGKPNEDGKPYKSSGGKMVWNDVLEKDIPEGWRDEAFTEIFDLKGGGTPNTNKKEYWDGSIPFFTPKDVGKSYFTINTIKNITTKGLEKCSSKLYLKHTVFVTARGTVGAISIAGNNMAMNQSCYAVLGNKHINQFFVHQTVLSVIEKLKSEAIGAVFKALVTRDFDNQSVCSPDVNIINLYGNKVSVIYNQLLNNSSENIKLEEIRDLLLSKMTKL